MRRCWLDSPAGWRTFGGGRRRLSADALGRQRSTVSLLASRRRGAGAAADGARVLPTLAAFDEEENVLDQ